MLSRNASLANRLLKRIRDFSQVRGSGVIDAEITKKGLAALGVDELGLERLDREILTTIIERFNGGPVGNRHDCGIDWGRTGHHRGRIRAISDSVRTAVPYTEGQDGIPAGLQAYGT